MTTETARIAKSLDRRGSPERAAPFDVVNDLPSNAEATYVSPRKPNTPGDETARSVRRSSADGNRHVRDNLLSTVDQLLGLMKAMIISRLLDRDYFLPTDDRYRLSGQAVHVRGIGNGPAAEDRVKLIISNGGGRINLSMPRPPPPPRHCV